jgi:DNA-directed RNA polymerase specialized sigma24 family protein
MPNTGTAWELTGEAFAKLLAGLAPNPEQAGEKYEELRLRLIKLFDWRGAQFPEDCADETLNRVARKLAQGETIQDIPTYCQGVARLVLLEKFKHPERQRADLEEIAPLAAPEPEETDERQACFEHCLRELPLESRQLIMQYYQDEKRAKINNRAHLAERLGIPLNALRSRAQRIRDRLEQCLERCLKKINAHPT